jgi:hypothetical protein
MTYEPRSDHHPVEPALRSLGELTLVGSRSLHSWPPIATPESDWDFYLVPKPAAATSVLESLGLRRLPGEGGPYGADQQIEGIWRLEAHTAYGRDWPGVDVIVCAPGVAAIRLPVLARIATMGRTGGLLCRGVKSERAWGAFWFASRPTV